MGFISTTNIQLGLPKGKMQGKVLALLAGAGIDVQIDARGYRPALPLEGFETKVLKPQNIVEMLHAGSRDIGFAGADWTAELGAHVVELLDTGLDPVRLVAAAPATVLEKGQLPDREIVLASEYENLSRRWIAKRGLRARFVRSYGATEVFPPEDADCIIDNTATGATLRSNQLEIIDELLTSSTRLFANPSALENPGKREAIECFVVLLQSVLQARARVMLEVNVGKEQLEAVIEILPCMRCPTISTLFGNEGFAVKAAVPRAALPQLIPKLKARGASDVIVTVLSQIVP